MFVKTHAGALVGIDAVAVTVEVDIAASGLGLYLVGLPDNAVKESEQRIRAAFENSGERMSGRKVVVNLAPADLRKEGSGFDLPIAVGILAAMGRIDAAALADTMVRCGPCGACCRSPCGPVARDCAAWWWRAATPPRRPWSTASR